MIKNLAALSLLTFSSFVLSMNNEQVGNGSFNSVRSQDQAPVSISQDQVPVSFVKSSCKKLSIPAAAKDPRVVAVASAAALHVVKHGMSCPLSQEAQWPAVAAVSGYASYKMLQSENKWVKVAAVLPAATTVLAALQK